MNPRVSYEMSKEELDLILDACKSTPVLFLGGGTPIGGSQQENANAAWARLGKKMGFDSDTVRPSNSGDRFFTAVPSETDAQRESRIKKQEEEQRQADIERLTREIAGRQTELDALAMEQGND